MRKSAPYIAAIFFLAVLFLNSWWLGHLNTHSLGDVLTYYYPRIVAQQQSILSFGNFFPLWNPYIFSGDPFLAKPLALNPVLGFLLLFLKPLMAIHVNVIIAMFLSGALMFVFVEYLLKNRMAAFISALVYMFSGFFLLTVVFYGWVAFANAYALMPLLLLFLFKSTNEKLFPNSVFAGIVLGLFIITGSGIEFLYASVVVGIFLFFNLIGTDFRKRLVNSAIIGIIVLALCFGVAAFKLLPVLEYQKTSIRSGLSWDEASGRTIPISRLYALVEPGFPKFFQDPSNKIGIFAFFLALFGVYKKFKSRYTIFFSLVALVSLLLATGSFLLYFFWKFYPGWSGMRYANRAIIIFIPAAAVLAGVGAASLFNWIKSRYSEKKAFGALAVLAFLIVANLAVFGSGGQSNAGDEKYKFRDIDEVVSSNSILQFLSKERQDGIFRIHTLETRGIDWGTEFYTVPLRLENIYGYDTQWMTSYFNGYLSVSSYSPAKMWGILNVKYLTSQSPVNITGFEFVNKFDNCTVCFPEEPAIQKAWGPYLYENEMFMPRAWLTDSAILVVGEDEPSTNIIYSLMVENSFDPTKAVIIKGGKTIDDYSLEELKRYKAVIFAGGALTSTNTELIKSYVSSGGKLLPDLSQGKVTATEDDVISLLKSISGNYKIIDDVNIETKDFSKKSVAIGNNEKMFLVLSERYSAFPGWIAYDSRNEYQILQADAAISAIYIEKPSGPIYFEYRLKSFQMGSLITIMALLGIIAYFIYLVLIPRILKKESAAS